MTELLLFCNFLWQIPQVRSSTLPLNSAWSFFVCRMKQTFYPCFEFWVKAGLEEFWGHFGDSVWITWIWSVEQERGESSVWGWAWSITTIQISMFPSLCTRLLYRHASWRMAKGMRLGTCMRPCIITFFWTCSISFSMKSVCSDYAFSFHSARPQCP